jgi:hypothetical protein
MPRRTLRDGSPTCCACRFRASVSDPLAVRDRQSGKVGTSKFTIPDVAHGAFALSGIVLQSDADVTGPSSGDDRVVISPSQAVRAYKPGAQLKYAYEIYNAGEPVQVAISVWRGTERVVSGPPAVLSPPPGQSLWFAAGGGFKLGEALTPGQYVLQVAASTTDPGKTGKVGRAVQTMDFEVK